MNVPTMNMGCMRAGDNPNRICGHANLQIDLRLLPSVDSEEIHAELERRIQKAVANSAMTLSKAYPPIPPFATTENGDLIQAHSSLSKHAPGTVAFSTEAHFLQTLGMVTLVWDTGSIAQAHQSNEYLAKAHITAAIATLRQVIQGYCID